MLSVVAEEFSLGEVAVEPPGAEDPEWCSAVRKSCEGLIGGPWLPIGFEVVTATAGLPLRSIEEGMESLSRRIWLAHSARPQTMMAVAMSMLTNRSYEPSYSRLVEHGHGLAFLEQVLAEAREPELRDVRRSIRPISG